MKCYLIIIVLILTSCIPASKKALEETNQNVLAVAKDNQMQAKAIDLIGKKQYGDKFIPVGNALKNNSNIIVDQARLTGEKDVGIFNWSAIKNGVVNLISHASELVGNMADSNPYTFWISTAIGLATTYFGGKKAVAYRRKEKVKTIAKAKQLPEDKKKYDDLIALAETELKTGKIKV